MGADLLLTWVGVEKGQEPDFDAARARIDELTTSDLEAAADQHYFWEVDSVIGDVAAAMKAEIGSLERLWVGGGREVSRIEIRGADLLFTGGMSWGDGATDAYDVIERLLAIPGVLEAAGFSE